MGHYSMWRLLLNKARMMWIEKQYLIFNIGNEIRDNHSLYLLKNITEDEEEDTSM